MNMIGNIYDLIIIYLTDANYLPTRMQIMYFKYIDKNVKSCKLVVSKLFFDSWNQVGRILIYHTRSFEQRHIRHFHRGDEKTSFKVLPYDGDGDDRERTNVIDLRVFGSGDFPASYECDSRLFGGNKSATAGNAQIIGYLSGI